MAAKDVRFGAEARAKMLSGIEIAANTIQELRSVTKGVHVMAIGWEQYIPQMLEQSQS